MAYLQKITVNSPQGTSVHNMTKFLYGTCSTAAATAAKVVTCADMGALEDGVTVFVKFTYGNTAAAPTLNVNSTGAKAIYYFGSTAPTADDNTWLAGSVVAFTYNGTGWVIQNAFQIATRAEAMAVPAGGSASTQLVDLKALSGFWEGLVNKFDITIPANTTTYTLNDTWFTADSACCGHNLDYIGASVNVSWTIANGSITFTLSSALSSALEFEFVAIKPYVIPII